MTRSHSNLDRSSWRKIERLSIERSQYMLYQMISLIFSKEIVYIDNVQDPFYFLNDGIEVIKFCVHVHSGITFRTNLKISSLSNSWTHRISSSLILSVKLLSCQVLIIVNLRMSCNDTLLELTSSSSSSSLILCVFDLRHASLPYKRFSLQFFLMYLHMTLRTPPFLFHIWIVKCRYPYHRDE